MASGQEHDKTTKQWAAPFAFIIGLLVDMRSGVISGIAFLIGGLWLSPDLDTHSISLKRWGILKSIWWPYRKVIPHRSIFSHCPFIGTAIRVAYLIFIGILIIYLLTFLDLADTSTTSLLQAQLMKTNQKDYFFMFLGVEASSWLHLIKDGDPFPK